MESAITCYRKLLFEFSLYDTMSQYPYQYAGIFERGRSHLSKTSMKFSNALSWLFNHSSSSSKRTIARASGSLNDALALSTN